MRKSLNIRTQYLFLEDSNNAALKNCSARLYIYYPGTLHERIKTQHSKFEIEYSRLLLGISNSKFLKQNGSSNKPGESI